MVTRFMGRKSGLLLLALLTLTGAPEAKAAPLSEECRMVLKDLIRDSFRNRADEIGYTNTYLGCWGQAVIVSSEVAARSFLGKGLSLFSNPAFVEAVGFSKHLCMAGASRYNNTRYPCWFEYETATQNVSMEEATRREAPKILFSDLQKAKDGTDVLQLTMCINDDPTKPKEYTQGCKRGYRATINEFGRGDFNRDNVEDILLTIKFGENTSQDRDCYMASFTRKDADFFKMISYSWLGRCQ